MATIRHLDFQEVFNENWLFFIMQIANITQCLNRIW